MAAIYARDGKNFKMENVDIRGFTVAVDIADCSKVSIEKAYFETETGLLARNVKDLSVSNASHNPTSNQKQKPLEKESHKSTSKVFLPQKITLYSEHKKSKRIALLKPITFALLSWHRYSRYNYVAKHCRITCGDKDGDV